MAKIGAASAATSLALAKRGGQNRNVMLKTLTEPVSNVPLIANPTLPWFCRSLLLKPWNLIYPMMNKGKIRISILMTPEEPILVATVLQNKPTGSGNLPNKKNLAGIAVCLA